LQVLGFNGATIFQPWKCQVAAEDGLLIYASMGPRFFNRGNDQSGSCSLPHHKLQWGHDFSTVEIQKLCFPSEPGDMLQWGHDFSTVEMTLPKDYCEANGIASMGPRFFNRGNWSTTMAHRLPPMSGFNGATIFQPWKSLCQHILHWRSNSFNGATIFQPWK